MFYRNGLRPLLFCLDPELVHDWMQEFGEQLSRLPLALPVLEKLYHPEPHHRLEQSLFGKTFQNPIGLAAGFDKNIRLTTLIQTLGFGFEEVGSITALPSEGNSRPRLFRLPRDQAVINRMGLNNDGVEALKTRLQYLCSDWPIGISIAKTHHPDIMGEKALDDFETVFRGIYGYGAYVSINISCPNTREGKTFEEPEALEALLARLRQAEADCLASTGRLPRPWCLKISPDLSDIQVQEVYELACRYGIAGWVVSNTTPRRDALQTSQNMQDRIGPGGLSGAPLRSKSTRILGTLTRLGALKQNMVLIGVGGILNPDDAWEKIIHGASLLQVYTGLIYQGPGLVKELHSGLLQRLNQHGFQHINDAIGSAVTLQQGHQHHQQERTEGAHR